MAAGFQYVAESNHIRLDVGVGVLDGIAHACLGSEVDHYLGLEVLEDAVNRGFVCNVALNKFKSLQFRV